VHLTPIGYIELRDGGSEFRPIRDPSELTRALIFGGMLGLVTLRLLLRNRRL
jgi:hypothetical protein